MDLMKKRIDVDAMEILYERPFTKETFEEDFNIKDGSWYVENGWLIGESRKNFASMAVMKKDPGTKKQTLATLRTLQASAVGGTER